MSSMQQFVTSLTVDAYGPVGTFDKSDGGDVTTTPVKHRQGGQIVETIYPSLPTFGTVTLERIYDNEFRNDQTTIASLRALVGQSMATVTEQPLDSSMEAFGIPRTYRGLLTGIHDGGVDANTEGARIWTVDIDVVSSAN